MSHTTTVSDIMITDVAALRSAVEELKRRGMNIQLRENATPRAYSQGQTGMGQAPFVVNIPDSKYDVGLYKVEGGYEARTDFYMGEVEKVLGVTPKKGESATQAKMGKLYQMYGVHAAEQQAFRQGYSPRRVEMADGTMQLQITVAA